MKKTRAPRPTTAASDDVRPEYRFDYRKARPNRFAARMGQTPMVVLVDPDIAEVFTTPESVNHALRALIKAMPKPRRPKPAAK